MFSKNIFLAVVLSVFLVITASCSVGNADVSGADRQPSASADEVTAEGSAVKASDYTPENISDDAVQTLIISEEALKLQSIEKSFLESDKFVSEHMVPLTFTKDNKKIIAFRVSDENLGDENQLILVGMPRQTVDLFVIDIDGDEIKEIGRLDYILNCSWSQNGRYLSLVSYEAVNILDIETNKLSDVPMQYEKSSVYNTNWEPDNVTLNIHMDKIANYYSYNTSSGKMEKTRGGFADGDIVYRGSAGGIVLASKGERVGVANGLYSGENFERQLYDNDAIIHDTNGSKLLLSNEDRRTDGNWRIILEEYDVSSGKRRTLYDEGGSRSTWRIYKASYIKTTGDVIYTISETDEYGAHYYLIRIAPDGEKTRIEVPSPLYTLTPGENLIHFASFGGRRSDLIAARSFQFLKDFSLNMTDLSQPSEELQAPEELQGPEFEYSDIRALMYRALDIYSSETPNIEKVKQVFINSYDAVPQEAQENILLEAEKNNLWQYNKLDIGKEITMTVRMSDSGREASVVLDDLYFRGPHQLVKKDGQWFITGLSTWPESKARDDVYGACKKYLNNEIKTGGAKKTFGDQFSDVRVGEIELWSMSEPHRANTPDSHVTEARVKLEVTFADGSSGKFMAYFSKRDTGSWKCSSIGKLSSGLFPGRLSDE